MFTSSGSAENVVSRRVVLLSAADTSVLLCLLCFVLRRCQFRPHTLRKFAVTLKIVILAAVYIGEG